MKIRTVIRSIFTFIGILALILLIYCVADAAYVNIANLNSGFYPEVFTFNDLNGNGRYDTNEPPLAGVCFDHMYEIYPASDNVRPFNCDDDWFMKTDENGFWKSDHPRSKRSCKDFYVVAMVPDGYVSTNTPADHFCNPEFGFAEEKTMEVTKFPSVIQYARREHLKTLGLKGLIFGLIPIISAVGTWWLNRK